MSAQKHLQLIHSNIPHLHPWWPPPAYSWPRALTHLLVWMCATMCSHSGPVWRNYFDKHACTPVTPFSNNIIIFFQLLRRFSFSFHRSFLVIFKDFNAQRKGIAILLQWSRCCYLLVSILVLELTASFRLLFLLVFCPLSIMRKSVIIPVTRPFIPQTLFWILLGLPSFTFMGITTTNNISSQN